MQKWIKDAAALTAILLLCAGCAKASSPVRIEASVPSPDAAETHAYTNVKLTVRRNAETVSERDVTDAAEIGQIEQIVFNQMVKSAAWPGVEASELEAWVCLSFDQAEESERQFYYQYDTEGRHVLQMGEEGMYTILSDADYGALMRLAGIEGESAVIEPDAAAARLAERLGTVDAATGNPFSYAYVETIALDGAAYLRFRVSWVVDGSHLSYLTDYLVSADGSEIFEYVPESVPTAAYTAILAEYADAERNGFYADVDVMERDARFGPSVAFEWKVNPSPVSYALWDVDGDGTDEMILAAGDDAGRTYYDLWTMDGDAAARPIEMDFGYRVNFRVLSDGAIEVIWSNSAFESGYDFYRLTGKEAQVVNSLSTGGDAEHPDVLQYYADGAEVSESTFEERLRAYEAPGDITPVWKFAAA